MRRALARALRRHRHERGAVAVVAVILSVVLLSVAALTIDLGQQRVGRTDMQSLADVVALDLSRELNGRTYATLSPLMSALAAKSEGRNQSVIGYSAHLPALSVTLGTWSNAASPKFSPTTLGTAIPNAVKVVAATSVGFAFGGITGSGSGNATRTAYGTADNYGCTWLGSYAARINSSSSPLLNALINNALGGSLNLDAVSYKGLASANVSLLGLATQLGLGSVDQLLTTSVTYKNLYIAAANVLAQNGDTADAAILTNIAGSITVAHNITLGNMLNLKSGDGAAETAAVNVLNLLQTTAQIANGSSGISIPGLSANLGLASATTTLNVIQPAQGPACHLGDSSSTAQVALGVTGTLTPPSLLGLTVSNATTNITVNVAAATGTLTGITCGSGTSADPSGEVVSVKSSLVGAGVSETLSINGSTANSGLLGLLSSIVSVQISGTLTLGVSTNDPSVAKTAQIRVPNNPSSYSIPIDTGSGSLGLDSSSVTVTNNLHIQVKALLGLVYVDANASQITSILNSIVSSLTTSVLNPVISGVNTTLLQPLEGILGLSLGGADVYGSKPTCGAPTLVG